MAPTKKPDPEPMARLNVRLPDALLQRVKEKAVKRRIKLTPLVAQLLEKWVREKT